MPTQQRTRPSVTRRDFVRLGIGLGGLGLADILRLRAQSGNTNRRPKSVINVVLQGGPSHLDLYDMKPDAPVEFRGELKPIRTVVPGFDISELLPLQAQIADKLAVVRSMRFLTDRNEHDLQEIFTGFPWFDNRPSFGSIVSRMRDTRAKGLPSYVSLGNINPSLLQRRHPEEPLYVGLRHRFFEFTGGDLNVMRLSGNRSPERVGEQISLRDSFDKMQRTLDARGEFSAMDEYSRQALEMIVSPAVRDAFEISKEPARVRDMYGPDAPPPPIGVGSWAGWYPGKFMLARRLVEAGVPVVSITAGSWDHHGVLSNGPNGGIYRRLREEAPRLDRTLHGLITDLDQRGLLQDVAVVVWGEMGRTPRINRQEGRDHWMEAGFALLAGGGLKTGQVVGATDAKGVRPNTQPYTPQNVFATLYKVLGIDPVQTIPDLTGRPMYLLDDRQMISELI